MKRQVFATSVQGASHKRVGKECQDNNRIELSDEITFIAVADGHGSDSCPYSRTGATIAVNSFYSVMNIYFSSYKKNRNGLKALMRFLNREGKVKVAKTIEAEWKRRVLKQHNNKGREIPLTQTGAPDRNAIYRMYGCTLLGLVITKSFTYAFQIGDGDIHLIDDEGVKCVIDADKMLGVETHSICKPNAWRKAKSRVIVRDLSEKLPLMYMLSTDGLANSFANDKEFSKNIQGYFDIAKENGFDVIEDNLEDWLNDTSENGCGDDITAAFAYFS